MLLGGWLRLLRNQLLTLSVQLRLIESGDAGTGLLATQLGSLLLRQIRVVRGHWLRSLRWGHSSLRAHRRLRLFLRLSWWLGGFVTLLILVSGDASSILQTTLLRLLLRCHLFELLRAKRLCFL